jgi:hypothetical protein
MNPNPRVALRLDALILAAIPSHIDLAHDRERNRRHRWADLLRRRQTEVAWELAMTALAVVYVALGIS